MAWLELDGLWEPLREVSQLVSKNAFRFDEPLRVYVDLNRSLAAVASPADVDVLCTAFSYNGEVDACR
jgi:hypothetical protein